MQHGYRYSKNEIHMHGRAMKDKLCHFGDSVYEVRVPIFAFKRGITQYQMNGKIYANDLKF